MLYDIHAAYHPAAMAAPGGSQAAGPGHYPQFGKYVTRRELVDRVRRMNDDLRAGNSVHANATSPVRSVPGNDVFVSRLSDYGGESLEQIRGSAASYEKRLRLSHGAGMAVGAAGILASFGAMAYAVHGLMTGGIGGAVAGIAVFAAVNYASRKAVDASNRMLEKAEGHAAFQTSLQGWVDFLADERLRQFEEMSRMATSAPTPQAIKSTPDAVCINGVWIPRKTPG